MKVTKAIIPVAGYGTRRMPITKSIEKCMLPLLNRPLIDYVVEDCAKAGITDIYFVVSGAAQQLRSYYERDVELEAYLEKSGKLELIDQIRPPENITFHYIEQDLKDPRYGTTVPVWLCRDYIQPGEKFLINMGDDHNYREDGGSDIADLIAEIIAADAGGGLVGVPLPAQESQRYGLFELNEAGEFLAINEHPKPDDKVSDLKNCSVYVVDSDFMKLADDQMQGGPDYRGEYPITEVINAYTASGKKMIMSRSKGKYFDCGTVESWVEANEVLLKLTRP